MFFVIFGNLFFVCFLSHMINFSSSNAHPPVSCKGCQAIMSISFQVNDITLSHISCSFSYKLLPMWIQKVEWIDCRLLLDLLRQVYYFNLFWWESYLTHLDVFSIYDTVTCDPTALRTEVRIDWLVLFQLIFIIRRFSDLE